MYLRLPGIDLLRDIQQRMLQPLQVHVAETTATQRAQQDKLERQVEVEHNGRHHVMSATPARNQLRVKVAIP